MKRKTDRVVKVLFVGFIMVVALTTFVPRSAQAVIDCWWSEMECSTGRECQWDPQRQIHWCMPNENADDTKKSEKAEPAKP